MIQTTFFDSLISYDERLLLAINGAWSPLLDHIMKFLSAVTVWFPLYLAIAILTFFKSSYSTECGGYAIRRPISQDKFWLVGIAAIAAFIMGYLFCDWGSNLVKAIVARPRPGYNPVTSVGRFPTGTGSPYGFFSAHAANTFCVAVLTGNIFGRRWVKVCMLIWAALISYSRMYLGYHFPLDVAVGTFYGICVGIILTKAYNLAVDRIAQKYPAINDQ